MIINYLHYVNSILGICGGLALIIASFKMRPAVSVWTIRTLRIAGFLAIIWGLLIIIDQSNVIDSYNLSKLRIDAIITFIGGIVFGILFTLFISDELSFKKWKK